MPSIASILWLALGALLNLFGSGKSSIPVATWLAPVFLLHFARLQSTVSGAMWLCLAGFLALSVWSLAFAGPQR